MAFLLEALCCVYLLPLEVSLWCTDFSIMYFLVLDSVGSHSGSLDSKYTIKCEIITSQ
jgi:hypothetical protein